MSRRKQPDSPVDPGRRRLLIGSGVVGAAATVSPGLLWPTAARAMHGDGDVAWTEAQLRSALEALRNDTFFALSAFAVPGDDPYSQVQGVSTAYPGGVGTRADLYLSGGTDLLVPMPAEFMQQMLTAVGAFLRFCPMEIPDAAAEGLSENEEWLLEHLDYKLGESLSEGVANSVLAALLVNLAATMKKADAATGPFVAPFANLSWADKAAVLDELDGRRSWLKTAVTWGVQDHDYRHAAPGVMQSLLSFVLRIGGFSAYNEFAVFNPANNTIAQRPLGWVLSQYQPSAPPVADGLADFIGYYQGRRSV